MRFQWSATHSENERKGGSSNIFINFHFLLLVVHDAEARDTEMTPNSLIIRLNTSKSAPIPVFECDNKVKGSNILLKHAVE